MTEQRSPELAHSPADGRAQRAHSVADHPEVMELLALLATAASALLVLFGVVVVAVLAIVPTVFDPAG